MKSRRIFNISNVNQALSPTHATCNIPLSLYIHMPWCVQKCPYCDFNSHQFNAASSTKNYVQALILDLENELPHIWGRSVHSIFFGGGTPSLFEGEDIDTLLSAIRARLNLIPGAEITLEANPGSVDMRKFERFKAVGVNRISVGVQSFNDRHLQQLGRIHQAKEAIQAIETALLFFDNVNVDIMYALPNQSVAEAKNDVQVALQFGVPHISAYQLTLEPNTPFGHMPPRGMPDSEKSSDIEDVVHETLARAHFKRYEVSAFTQKEPCAHNLNYWQFGDYLGIGAGAHGKITTQGIITRTQKLRHPKGYLQAVLHGKGDAKISQVVDTKDLAFEFMMNALRLTSGVPAALFSERTGLSLSSITKALQRARDFNLLADDALSLRATDTGQRFLNDLLALFLPD